MVTQNIMLNYQKSTLKIKCKGCNDECEPVYDRHHDQTFSTTCGRVLIQSNQILIDYPTDHLFWQKQKQRREEIKELKRILNKIKEYQLEYTTTEDIEIILPTLNNKELSMVKNLCEETIFHLILEKKYDTHHKYIGSQYIIKKKGDQTK